MINIEKWENKKGEIKYDVAISSVIFNWNEEEYKEFLQAVINLLPGNKGI